MGDAVKILYLHGFASGPQSKKGVEMDTYFSARGHDVERLNLRVPSFEHLRLSAMIDTVIAAIDRAGRPVVLIGSSLGGLTAARVAERDDRVVACVLLAPAFQLVERWRQQLGAEWDVWRATGTRQVADYTTGGMSTVDFAFVEDVERIDVGYPDVRVPALVMHGKNDDVVPIDRARTFAAGRPNVRLIELDDGHELVASLPVLLAESEAFLDGLSV
jgi:alpha-beta hydrolase superfamily lysophospholipase